jgi:hypothetical protein
MSTATIRSPADCIEAVLRNLDFELLITVEQGNAHRRMQQAADVAADGDRIRIHGDLAHKHEEIAKRIRAHIALIRTECASFLVDHAETVPGGAL